jgi:hypothetical protein
MGTTTLNSAYFGQGVTLAADIEKLLLSAADLAQARGVRSFWASAVENL